LILYILGYFTSTQIYQVIVTSKFAFVRNAIFKR